MLKAVEKTIQTNTASIHCDRRESPNSKPLRCRRTLKRDFRLGQVRINKVSTRGLLAHPMKGGTRIVAWRLSLPAERLYPDRWRLVSR